MQNLHRQSITRPHMLSRPPDVNVVGDQMFPNQRHDRSASWPIIRMCVFVYRSIS